MKITAAQVVAAYQIAARVFDKQIKATHGVEILVSEYGLNRATAGDFINDYKCLLQGRVFHRAMSTAAIRYFMEQISVTSGKQGLANAVASLRAHIEYYEGHFKVTMHSFRAVADEFEALINNSKNERPSVTERKAVSDLTAIQKEELQTQSRRAFGGVIREGLIYGFRVMDGKDQIAAVYYGDNFAGNDVEVAICDRRFNGAFDPLTVRRWLDYEKTAAARQCNVHKHGSDWWICGFTYADALLFLGRCRQLRLGLLEPKTFSGREDNTTVELIHSPETEAEAIEAEPKFLYVDQFAIGADLQVLKHESIRSEFVRSRIVRDVVLQRAQGICELCGEPGFTTKAGSVFLETHHVVPLSEGGADTVNNVAALCPNDHREAHHGARASAIREQLLKWLCAPA